MPDVVFSLSAWEDYLWWQSQDRKTLKRINALIRDINRSNHEGIGQPEPLRGDHSGCWSRRINDKDRLVYRIAEGGSIQVIAVRGHYT
ncbi:MAG: Txe/YoeB family addiction module toxin [Bifidobacteriaceae bacterium]|jgi:toxin YoeB|nr:Txe/YoeB family addiction module toxin [Bifidobacteriaceae bacterium]